MRKLERMKSRGKVPEENEVDRKQQKGGKTRRRKEEEDLRSSSRRAGIRISVKDGKEGVQNKAEARKVRRQEARRQKKGMRGRRRRKEEVKVTDRYRTGARRGTDKRLTRVEERAEERRDKRRKGGQRGDHRVAWSNVGMTPGGLILLKRQTNDGRNLYKKAAGDKLGGRDRWGHDKGRDTRTPWWRDTQGTQWDTQRGKQGTHRVKQRDTGRRLHGVQNQVL